MHRYFLISAIIFFGLIALLQMYQQYIYTDWKWAIIGEKKEIIIPENCNDNSKVEIISRSSTGSAAIYRSTITVYLLLSEEDKVIKQKKFASSFTYNKNKNKFDFIQYQKNIKVNLINKITEEIFIFLNT